MKNGYNSLHNTITATEKNECEYHYNYQFFSLHKPMYIHSSVSYAPSEFEGIHMVDKNITTIGRKAPKGVKTVYTRYSTDFFTGKWIDLFEEEGDMKAEIWEDPKIPAKMNVYKQMEELYGAIKVAKPTVQEFGNAWFKRIIFRVKRYSLHPQMVKKQLVENNVDLPAMTKEIKVLVKALHKTAPYKAIVAILSNNVAGLTKSADAIQDLVDNTKGVDKDFFPPPRK